MATKCCYVFRTDGLCMAKSAVAKVCLEENGQYDSNARETDTSS